MGSAREAFLLALLLCFHALPLECRGGKLPVEASAKKPLFNAVLKRILVSIILGVASGLAGAVVFLFLVRFVVLYLNRTPLRKGPVVFSLKTSPASLQSAIENDCVLLGSKYYKACLDGGLTIAVKKLDPFEGNSRKSFKRRIQKEMEILAGVRHCNLMTLRAYISSPDKFSVVYDYLPNGSLDDAMNKVRENQLHLGWDMRQQIAVGIVKCLRFLHFECSPRILHYNLKPSNVLLDAELQPRLTDAGYSMFYMGVSPYSAPEFVQARRYTEKSEIYSFGMILAVLLTGRDPSEAFFKEENCGGGMAQWLRQLQVEGEAKEALRIAVVCLSELPADRPCSDELVPMLSRLHSF